MNFKIILSVILAGLSLLFIIQNLAVINIRFLFGMLPICSSLLMFLLFLIGFIPGWLLSYDSIHRKEKKELIT